MSESETNAIQTAGSCNTPAAVEMSFTNLRDPGSAFSASWLPLVMPPRFYHFLCILSLLALDATSVASAEEAPAAPRSPSAESLVVSASDRDRRLGWWREARFGVFVHWGVYSLPAGTWRGEGSGGYSEHLQRRFKIPIPVYQKEVAARFNPVAFNAEEWVRLAQESGAGYLVVTAKHHDGFAMFASQASDYNIVKATPFGRDPMPALRDACRRAGLRFGLYYSHAFDWGEPDAPGNDWDYENPGGDRLLHGADWWLKDEPFLAKARGYVDRKAIPQLLELIHNYDPDLLWFDTPHKLPLEENLRILAAVRRASPDVVVNGRVLSGRYQSLGLTDYRNTTDKPAEFPPQQGDWEAIPTTNESYGYNENDSSHKPAAHFIGLLVKAAARGGNTLVNLGPRGDGSIDPRDQAIFHDIGAWWKTNGDSVRGTTRTPLPVQAWGESTCRGNLLYLHVFQWPSDGRLVVGGLISPIAKAWLLAEPGNPLTFSGTTVNVPATAPDPNVSVVAVELAEPLRAEPVRCLSASVPANTLRAFDGEWSGGLQPGPGKIHDDWLQGWKSPNAQVQWQVRAGTPMTFDVEIAYDAPAAQAERLIEGDAGQENTQGRRGAGGTYSVQIADSVLIGEVRPGSQIVEKLGRVVIPAGVHTIKVQARAITGEELFRLRHVRLFPCD